jgi:hypothetical protein
MLILLALVVSVVVVMDPNLMAAQLLTLPAVMAQMA